MPALAWSSFRSQFGLVGASVHRNAGTRSYPRLLGLQFVLSSAFSEQAFTGTRERVPTCACLRLHLVLSSAFSEQAFTGTRGVPTCACLVFISFSVRFSRSKRSPERGDAFLPALAWSSVRSQFGFLGASVHRNAGRVPMGGG